MPDAPTHPRWLHRWTILLVVLVWPLIWVGGLVTTYDAGMSVPDWPGTYGYNLFLYPWKTWLYGPFDLFIEHGHRLLASLVGLITIGVVGVAWWTEPRRWVRWLAYAALVAVIFQGVLGGLRVVLDARFLAMLHGCVGPAFFALCAVLAAATSRWWFQRAAGAEFRPVPARVATLAAVLVGCIYLQLVVGAQLRHIDFATLVFEFRHLVATHIVLALSILVISLLLPMRMIRCGDLTLSLPSVLLVFLVMIQIGLGLGTWAVNYGWPAGADRWHSAAAFLIQAKGFTESIIVTAHVATGSLMLALATWLWFRLRRVAQPQSRASLKSLLTEQVTA